MMKIHEAMKASLILAAQTADAKKRLDEASKACPSYEAHEAAEKALEAAENEHDEQCDAFAAEYAQLPEYAIYIELERAMHCSKRHQIDALADDANALATEMYPGRPELQGH